MRGKVCTLLIILVVILVVSILVVLLLVVTLVVILVTGGVRLLLCIDTADSRCALRWNSDFDSRMSVSVVSSFFSFSASFSAWERVGWVT